MFAERIRTDIFPGAMGIQTIKYIFWLIITLFSAYYQQMFECYLTNSALQNRKRKNLILT